VAVISQKEKGEGDGLGERNLRLKVGFKWPRGTRRAEWVNGGWPTGSDTQGEVYLVLSVRKFWLT
jgi:hypothetical protein